MSLVRIAACCVALAAPAASLAQSTLFRVTDLDLRDPHVWVSIIGCNDVTDAPGGFNQQVQTSIQGDGDGDGFLDVSYMLEFLPLNQAAATNLIDTGTAQCRAPSGTPCGPLTPAGIAGDATLQTTGECLTFLPGTVRPYTPAITPATGPCFLTPTGDLAFTLGGVPIALRSARIAATFPNVPATSLTNGLIAGFLTESDANATTIPASVPLIGGRPLSSVLPGGTGNCQGISDKDTNGVPGWWFYLNFTAVQVQPDPFANGFANGFE